MTKPTRTVATKGQVVLPENAGSRRDAIDIVFGSLAYDGPAKTIEQMDAAVAAEARRRA